MNNTINNITGLVDKFDQVFLNMGLSSGLTTFVRTFLVAVVILGLAVLADFLTKKIILRGIKTLARRTKTRLDDILVERRVFHKIAHIVPALLVYLTAKFVFKDYSILEGLIERASLIYLVIVVVLAIDSFINALHEISSGINYSGVP